MLAADGRSSAAKGFSSSMGGVFTEGSAGTEALVFSDAPLFDRLADSATVRAVEEVGSALTTASRIVPLASDGLLRYAGPPSDVFCNFSSDA